MLVIYSIQDKVKIYFFTGTIRTNNTGELMKWTNGLLTLVGLKVFNFNTNEFTHKDVLVAPEKELVEGWYNTNRL